MQPASATIQEDFGPPLLRLLPTHDARWLALYTSSRHEKRVAQQLSQRSIEVFLPLIEKQHRWAKRSLVRLELPLFPNYLFVHIAPEQRIAVLNVPGVLAIVGQGRAPSPLVDAEVDRLRAAVALGRAEPHPGPAAGERVRIHAGPMAGMEGILLRRKNQLRLVLTLDLIQRSVAVEIDAQDVEPVRCRAI